MSYEIINKEYQNQLKIAKLNDIKLLSVASLITIAIVIISAIYYDVSVIFMALLFIFLPISLIALSIILVVLFGHSQKPYSSFLLGAILKEYAQDEGLTIEYVSKDNDTDFFKKGGLFTNSSTKTIKCRFDYTSDNGSQIKIYNGSVFTRSRNHITVHFDGLYVVLPHMNNTVFQLRSKGKEYNKEHKLLKINTKDDVIEFVQDSERASIEKRFYQLYDYMNALPGDQRYIAGINGELHIAINQYFWKAKIANFNHDDFQQIKRYFKDLIEHIEHMLAIIVY
ncbi:MAG: hypothetical protein KKG64_02770 [Firmicutes bacterium]|nr:hypothetical protein [Bacillota bacterium]